MSLQASILKSLILEKQLKNINFLKESCFQINKDLNGLSKFQIQLTEQLLDYPLDSLAEQLIPIISDLESNRNLQAFIYKVDLAEKKYLAYKLKQIDKMKFINHIIERCSQKIFLRWHFSNRL